MLLIFWMQLTLFKICFLRKWSLWLKIFNCSSGFGVLFDRRRTQQMINRDFRIYSPLMAITELKCSNSRTSSVTFYDVDVYGSCSFVCPNGFCIYCIQTMFMVVDRIISSKTYHLIFYTTLSYENLNFGYLLQLISKLCCVVCIIACGWWSYPTTI